MDHLFYSYQFVQLIWGQFSDSYRVSFVRNRDCSAVMEEFVVFLPFKDKEKSLWQAWFFVGVFGLKEIVGSSKGSISLGTFFGNVLIRGYSFGSEAVF